MKIALGTVQFGLDYGIANKSGQVSQAAAESILRGARQHGVDTIDTAIAYGESETILGAIGISDFKIVTKLPSIPVDCRDVGGWVYQQCLSSLDRMQVNSIDGLLLHRSEELVSPSSNELIKAFQCLKDDGLVKKVGVSIYSPSELETVTQVCDIDIVQAPFNVFDRRLLTSGWLHKLNEDGIEVHTRSVFLQGLLLMHELMIPSKFSRWRHLWRSWYDWLDKSSISALQVCLAFVHEFPEIDKVVIGVDSVQQFNQIMDAAVPAYQLDFPEITCEDELLINPSNWNSL